MGVFQGIAQIGYLVLSIFQFFAIIAGFDVWLGLGSFISTILALFLAGIPLLGTLVGMFGAVQGWGWTWLDAGLLFIGPALVILLLAGAATWLDHRAKGA